MNLSFRPIGLLSAICLATLIYPSAQAGTTAGDNFSGRYEWGEFAPPHQTWVYVLTIAEDGTAKLQADGFQTLIRAQGHVEIDGSACKIVFNKTYEDKELEAPAETMVFKSGEALFSLERRSGKLVTHWGRFSANLPEHQKDGVYFKRDK